MYLYTISYEHIELSYSIFCLYWQTTPHTLLHHVWKDTHSQKLGNSGECTVCHPVTICSNVHPARLMTCPYRTLDSWGPNQILSLPKCHQNIPTCCGRETTPPKNNRKKTNKCHLWYAQLVGLFKHPLFVKKKHPFAAAQLRWTPLEIDGIVG